MSKQDQIDAINNKITELQAEVDKLQEPEDWHPAYGNWFATQTCYGDGANQLNTSRKSGVMSQTEANAKERHELLRTTARLHAYVEEFGGGEQGDYYIYKRHDGLYDWHTDHSLKDVGKVYMNYTCAYGLVDKLNSGEVVL